MNLGIRSRQTNGFALIVTLSLMILLTIMAVGMLSLASISLRTTSQGSANAIARANARMALLLAIGELQTKTGPDQRITAPANLVNSSHPIGVTGVWRSWRPDPNGVSPSGYDDHKTGDNFLGYLISDPNPSSTPDPGSVPSGKDSQILVGEGSLGTNVDGRLIEAPLVVTQHDNNPQGAYAWVVLDEGVKGRIDLKPADDPSGLGEQVARLGSPARNRFHDVACLDFLESSNVGMLRSVLPKMVSMRQVELESSQQEELKQYFHDLTVSSSSLQTDTANGGLKTDLSVAFDGDFGSSMPKKYLQSYVYSDDETPFPDASANSDPLWALYANYSRLYRMSSSQQGDARDGIVASVSSRFRIKRTSDRAASPTINRYEPDMRRVNEPVLMPTVVGVDMVFSLVTHFAHRGHGTSTYPYQLHLMYLPVITLHNPFNTKLRCQNFNLEFADVPIGFQFLVNGQPANSDGKLVPLGNLYVRGTTSKNFSVTLSTNLNRPTEVVLGPGETRIFGTPFPKDDTWAKEVAANGDASKGAKMFDWGDNMTGELKMIPGMITGPNDGIGFDVDWLAPANRASWLTSRRDDGVIILRETDSVAIRFGPLPRTNSVRSFTLTATMNNQEAGVTQVVYKDDKTLEKIMAEGVSPRFPDERSFPAMFPSSGAPLSTLSLFEADGRRFSEYVNARPFAVFSMGAKTTVESFTKGRPFADTGIAFQMATCDFRSTTSQGASPLEFALVPVQNGGAAIEVGGQDGDRAFCFGGKGVSHGTSAGSVYEIPVAPLQSIAQLRHANAASLGSEPFVTYSVGESRAHPAIPAERSFFERSRYQTLVDHSFLANSTLWDGYWFSTLATLEGPAYSGFASMSQAELSQKFFAGDKPLPNPRNRPYLAVDPNKAATAATGNAGESTAAFVVTDGGFNVNSTSVEAWEAVLSGLAKTDVPLATGVLESTADTPFPRFRRPAHGSDGDAKERLWNSYRTLNSGQIKQLAENVVKQVRARGPFLSMAEFVNRRLGPSGELTNKGAIQAAIDQTDINSIMLSNARPVTPAEVADYGWENPEAVQGNTGAGSPGELSQGDVLTAIGSFATVRSDTFRIRAYGEARDMSGNNVTAKAWCEAVVQRVPEYVDAADAPDADPTTEVNKKFGRQFRMTSFRWLSSDEI